MTTLTVDGAIDEALAFTDVTPSTSRLGGAGYIKGLARDVILGSVSVPSSVSRLSARGKLLAELSTLYPAFYAPLTHSITQTIGTATPSFTRATAATVLGYGPTANSGDSQVLLSVASGEARFQGARRISEGVWSDTFADGSLIPSSTLKGYLAEEARTNLFLQSNALTTSWTQVASPATTQNATGIDGATSAWTLTDSSAVANASIDQIVNPLTAASYTWSLFVKKTTAATTFPALFVATGTVCASATLNTNAGIATAWAAYTGYTMLTGVSVRCSNYNANFWRFELTFTATAASYDFFFAPAATSNANQSSGTWDATTQGSAVVCGMQLELGASASTYIPTTTGSVPRNKDELVYTGALIGTLKSLACSFERVTGVSSTGVSVAHSDGTTTHYAKHELTNATAHVIAGGASGAQWSMSPTAYSAGSRKKAAWSMATNDIKGAYDGTGQTQDTSATVPTVDRLEVGMVAAASQLNGNVGGIYGWTRNLSQAELNGVTV